MGDALSAAHVARVELVMVLNPPKSLVLVGLVHHNVEQRSHEVGVCTPGATIASPVSPGPIEQSAREHKVSQEAKCGEFH